MERLAKENEDLKNKGGNQGYNNNRGVYGGQGGYQGNRGGYGGTGS